MLWKVSDLKLFSIRAKDGEIGGVSDLLFSDVNWTIRYFVVTTGEWLERREVLISPRALDVPNGPARAIPASLTREQVRDAPPVDTEKPVSRHYEVRYHDYYGWPYYWVGGAPRGPFLTVGEMARAALGAKRNPDPEPENPDLRSVLEVEGYRFEGRDGEIGHVEDFLVDDENWSIAYVEIDTRNWWPGGKKVLLAAHWTSEIDWAEHKLKADVHRGAVKAAPEYDASAPVTEAFEAELAKHYGLERSVGSFR